MSREYLKIPLRFFALLLMQLFVFNNMLLFSFIQPYIYILFILSFPIKTNQMQLLLWSFALGLFLDFFTNTGGIHATACLIIAYIRPPLLRLNFGISTEYQTTKIENTPLENRLAYISILVVIHHFIVVFLEVLRFSFTLYTLKTWLFSSALSILIITLLMHIFNTNKK